MTSEIIGVVHTKYLGPFCPEATYNVIEVIKQEDAVFFVTDEIHDDIDDGEIPLVVADIMVAKFEPNEKYNQNPH